MRKIVRGCLYAVITWLAFVSITGLSNEQTVIDAAETKTEKQKEESLVKSEPLTLQVTLQKHYIDGKVVEQTHEETVWAMQDFWSYYDGWQVVDQKEGKVTFRKEISDISPYIKENGYFGIKNNILTIFEGRPVNSQVIQSFYQIDTKELESYQAEQLREGIKIKSKEVYQYVLEAYRKMIPNKTINS
ncbi:intercompartmental signaling factor BofC [Radiobacillus kanasensis]|uniref:BofC C-terminal domain-containing protein n=1 Tax=Radiobacillus kanasensis TaxID=2844358 RepID=UPI001E438BD2|nr:BofC C-terminal domain-containing protein [Radiobacillus kanasensis]UFT97901.1 intercompartmental signaling factor BofC [Radiobacillus kanasensis]